MPIKPISQYCTTQYAFQKQPGQKWKAGTMLTPSTSEKFELGFRASERARSELLLRCSVISQYKHCVSWLSWSSLCQEKTNNRLRFCRGWSFPHLEQSSANMLESRLGLMKLQYKSNTYLLKDWKNIFKQNNVTYLHNSLSANSCHNSRSWAQFRLTVQEGALSLMKEELYSVFLIQ